MNYPWLESYCESKKYVVKDFKLEWEATRFMIDGKMFLYIGENNLNQPIATLKLEPEFGVALRETYKNDILPGYYMNKIHWNTVLLDGYIPDDLFKEMIDQAYQLIFHSLSKKRQKELLGEA